MNTPTPDTAPLVTVITVTYNSSSYVRDAIESVLRQDYGNIEYIIGDDCSTDDTWDIIGQYNDPRIRSYRNERNIGEYPNRNKALGMARGKYLLFLDGDDYIYRHGIAYYVSMLEQFPEAAFSVQKGYYNNIIFPIVLQPGQSVHVSFFSEQNLLTSSFSSDFFRTEILRANGGLSEQYKTGDEEIRLRLACKYPVLFIQGWVTWPRETPGQASAQLSNGRGLLEMMRITEACKKDGLLPAEVPYEVLRAQQERQLGSIVLRSACKLRFRYARSLMSSGGISLARVFRTMLRRPLAEADLLKNYNAVKPLRYEIG